MFTEFLYGGAMMHHRQYALTALFSCSFFLCLILGCGDGGNKAPPAGNSSASTPPPVTAPTTDQPVATATVQPAKDLDAETAKAFNAHIATLPKVDVKPSSDTVIEDLETAYVDANSQPSKSIVQRHEVTLNFDSLAAFDPNADTLWPGAIVPGDSLVDGVFRPITLSRAPGTITAVGVNFTQPNAEVSRTVKVPNLANVEQVLQGLLSQQNGASPAKIALDMRQFYSLEQGFTEVGLSAKYLSSSLKTSLDSKSYLTNTNFIVKFLQSYYTVTFPYPGSPSGFLAHV